MKQDGVFGEIIRAEGAYIHELSQFWRSYCPDPNDNDKDNLHWRLKYNYLTIWYLVLRSTVVIIYSVYVTSSQNYLLGSTGEHLKYCNKLLILPKSLIYALLICPS